MANEIVKKFSMDYEVLQVRAQVKAELLTGGHLALFTTKFPSTDAAWLTSFKADITTAKNFPDDNSVIVNIKVLTEDVNSSVAEGFTALDRLDIYARVAYASSPAKQRVFGQDKWGAARNDQEKARQCLINALMYANVAPYKAALTGAGMNPADIAALDTIAGNIDLKNTLQEAAFAGRPVSTEDRIMVHNIVYDKMALLKIESEEVFRGDPARINQYNIYPPAAGVSTTLNIKVKKAGLPVADATVELTNTGLAVQSVDVTGLVSFTSINMPDFVNIKVSSPTEGDLALDNQPVINGDENSIEISYP